MNIQGVGCGRLQDGSYEKECVFKKAQWSNKLTNNDAVCPEG